MIKKLKILSFYLVSALFVLAPNYSLASTRAIQIEMLINGVTNPTTGERVAAGTAYFYDAGTTDAANVWTEKEKTNPYSSYTLDAIGAAQLYGEGNYKIVIKDSGGATVDTFDNIRLEFPYYGIRTVTYGTTTMLSEDDYILCNTTGGDVTINFLSAAVRSRPLKVQRISGANDIIIDPSGSETIDSAATLTISTDAIVEIVSDGSNLRTAGYRSGQSDADGDTQLIFDEILDEDKIRMDVAGDEKFLLSPDATESYIQVNKIADEDNDTFMQVEESADEDTIRFDIGGSQVATIDTDGITADEVDSPVFKLNGSDISPELALIDGLTATYAELNILDGATLNVSDLNIIDGLADSGSLTAAELLQLDGVTVGGNSAGDILTTDDSQTLSNKAFSQDGAVTITDVGSAADENPLNLLGPNATSTIGINIGTAVSNNNAASILFNGAAGSGSANNYVQIGVRGTGVNTIISDGSGNVSIGTGAISTGAALQIGGEIEATSGDINGVLDVSSTAEIHDTLTLSKGSGNGLVVTSNVDFNGNEDLAGTLDIGSGTTRRAVPGGTAVNIGTGEPLISLTSFDVVSNVTESSFESVGPTGSGATNIWTAMDSVPDDAEWVVIDIDFSGTDAIVHSYVDFEVYARATGSSSSVGATTKIAACVGLRPSAEGAAYCASRTTRKIQVDSSQRFDITYSSEFTTDTCSIYLVEWGFNP